MSEHTKEMTVESATIMADTVSLRTLAFFVACFMVFLYLQKINRTKTPCGSIFCFVSAFHGKQCTKKSPYAGIIRIRLRVQGLRPISADCSAPLFLCGFDVSVLYSLLRRLSIGIRKFLFFHRDTLTGEVLRVAM
jgi:hypothetical protein